MVFGIKTSSLCDSEAQHIIFVFLWVKMYHSRWKLRKYVREIFTYRLSPVSWSIRLTGMLRSISSWGESFDCRLDKRMEWAVARRFRTSFDLWIVAFGLINDEVVVVWTSGISWEFVDEGLADPVDCASAFRASRRSLMFTISSLSAVNKKLSHYYFCTSQICTSST